MPGVNNDWSPAVTPMKYENSKQNLLRVISDANAMIKL